MAIIQDRGPLPIGTRLGRTAGLAVPVTGALVVVFLITGLGGFRGGWLWAPVLATPPLALLGWLGWGRHRGRGVATATLALGGIALGLWVSQNSVLSHGRLRAAMNSIQVPASFQPVSDEVLGAGIFLDEPNGYARNYTAPGDAAEVEAELRDTLERQGFVMGEWRDETAHPGAFIAKGHRGRLGVAVVVDSERVSGQLQYVTPASGHVGATLTLETYDGT